MTMNVNDNESISLSVTSANKQDFNLNNSVFLKHYLDPLRSIEYQKIATYWDPVGTCGSKHVLPGQDISSCLYNLVQLVQTSLEMRNVFHVQPHASPKNPLEPFEAATTLILKYFDCVTGTD